MLRLLQEVNWELGVTVIDVTHEMEVVRSIADRVAVLEAGRVVELGTVVEVFSAPRSAAARSFVGSVFHDSGGGGLGPFAIQYGYQRFMYEVTLVAVVLIVILVQAVQYLGNHLARKALRR